MTHRQLRQSLGGHRFQAKHQVATILGSQPEQSYTDDYFLECTASGDCHGRLDNSLEYGVEVVRKGEETFFRHRYQEFLRFVEEREEAERRLEHLWGIGASVLDLLAPLVRLEPMGQADVAGRKALRYKLKPRQTPGIPAGARGARAWRAKMSLDSLEGEIALDVDTGAPLGFTVRYKVSAPKGGQRFTLLGNLQAEITSPGIDPVISPPEKFSEAAPRDREALEVRALLGDRRLNPGWFRGGGPHAARERPRQGVGQPAPSPPAAPPMGVMAPPGPRATP